MNRLVIPALIGFLTWACGPLQAQDQPASSPGRPIQTGTYRFVTNDEILRHGDVLTITRKGGAAKLSGVFVYADEKSGRLFVRPQPLSAPVAIAANDVEKIDRITPAVGRADSGEVRAAFRADEKSRPAYEIHEMLGHNGPYTAVYFYESTLSPGERQQLLSIEKASGEVVEKGLRARTRCGARSRTS